jgi:hypothetical protein
LEPDALEVLNDAVAEELARQKAEEEARKALEPPAPPREKTWHEKWGLTPPEEEGASEEAPPALELDAETEAQLLAADPDGAASDDDEPPLFADPDEESPSAG